MTRDNEPIPLAEAYSTLLDAAFYPSFGNYYVGLSQEEIRITGEHRRQEHEDWNAQKARVLQDAHKSQLLISAVDQALGTIPPRNRKVLELKFGISDGYKRTLREVAEESRLGLGIESIRRISLLGLRGLRHTSRRTLEPFLPKVDFYIKR